MFENVLIGVDGRQGGQDAIALARQLASTRARLTLVNVYGAGLMAGRGAALLLASECRLSEQLLVRERQLAGVDAELDCCAEHSVGRALRTRAALLGADLIVVGSSAHNLVGRCAFGDDTAAVLAGARCAVAIAPRGHATAPAPIRRIGVAHAAGSAEELASATALARELAGRITSDVEIETLREWPHGSAELDRCDFELLVLGSNQTGRLGRLLHSSAAERLVRGCRCPVLVLPTDGSPLIAARRLHAGADQPRSATSRAGPPPRDSLVARAHR